MKYSHKNQRTDSFYWRGSVLAVGHKNFCDEELARVRIQVTEADGNVSFQRVVQKTDPNLTVYEDVEQILLKEGLDSQVAKRKLKLCPSSQQNACSELETQDDYNEQGLNYSAPNEYAPFILMKSHNIWKKLKMSTKLFLIRLNPTRLMMHWQRNILKPSPICQLQRIARQLSNQNVAQHQQTRN